MGRPFCRIVIEESDGGVRVRYYRPRWRWLWHGAAQGLYRTYGDCLMGLAESYLEAAKQKGAKGRKERRRLAAKIAAKLVG